MTVGTVMPDEAIALLNLHCFIAIAFTVADDVNVNAPVYFVLDDVGADPSVV